MNTQPNTPTTIAEYIAALPEDQQARAKELRSFISKLAPEATETISYQMPTFELFGKHLVYFACFKNHIGFYPFPSGIAEFKDEAEKLGFTTSKGTIQFPHDKPIPWDLVEKIVKFRIDENQRQVLKYFPAKAE